MAESVVQTWRAVDIGAGGFVIGLACLVIFEYLRNALHKRSASHIHVVLIGCSYVLLRAASFHEQLHRYANGDPLSYRLVLLTLGDLMGIAALAIILRAVARR